jgi:DNA-binding NarL/FixJ family response regulator
MPGSVVEPAPPRLRNDADAEDDGRDQAHVRGFIVKDAPAETLADGVRRVAGRPMTLESVIDSVPGEMAGGSESVT